MTGLCRWNPSVSATPNCKGNPLFKAIIPLCLFINERGLAKIEIALCQGKHSYDKRQSLREADDKREIARAFGN